MNVTLSRIRGGGDNLEEGFPHRCCDNNVELVHNNVNNACKLLLSPFIGISNSMQNILKKY